jgi:crotonobetainyl-CoA:carnitine CoA-transferase CaiB-like acyl-CoA transferase
LLSLSLYALDPLLLGEHTAEVMAELGYGAADVAALRTKGVLGALK